MPSLNTQDTKAIGSTCECLNFSFIKPQCRHCIFLIATVVTNSVPYTI
ncbi:SWIM zinc finger family protein [Vibrio cyclitrophicus]